MTALFLGWPIVTEHREVRCGERDAADDALALVAGRLKHMAMSDGMWEDSRAALMVLGYTRDQIDTALVRYGQL